MAKLTQKQIYALAIIVGVPKPRLMAAVAMAESSGRTGVVNSIGATGLWQINQPVWVKKYSKWTVKWLQNPINNAIAAKQVYKDQGVGAWEVYTSGAYKRFYDEDVSNASLKPSDLNLTQSQFDAAVEGMEGVLVGETEGEGWLEDELNTLDATGQFVISAWETLTTPAFWMRIAYGITGVTLIAGGLFLIVRNTPAVKSAAQSVKQAGSVTPVGRATKVAKGT